MIGADVCMQGMHAVSAWQPLRDQSCDPGWMLPLVILARTYSTFLSTFGDDYMYRLQKPLPLSELYQPNQRKGLLSLLKFAMWQVLSAPSPHLLRPAWQASIGCSASVSEILQCGALTRNNT